MESVIAGGATSLDHIHFEVDPVETLAPEMERLGVAVGKNLCAETLADRVLGEVVATESVIVCRSEVGAWSHV
jgi:hypothetical protein